MQPEYLYPPRQEDVATAFDRAMHVLRLSNNGARQLLGNRLSLGMIKHMRAGRRNIPTWAIEIFCRELGREAAYRQAVLDSLPLAAGPGRRGASLMAYRAHRAAQKEKAGN